MYLCQQHSAAFYGDCPICEHPEVKALKLQIEGLQKVVDAAVEWWADPHDTSKTIVDLQNAVEAYWENHKTEKPLCEYEIHPAPVKCGLPMPCKHHALKRKGEPPPRGCCVDCGAVKTKHDCWCHV
jgi:hypothetical protein